MFRISRRLDYGLQLMIALANEPEGKPQSTASLADKLQIPLPFLHQIGHMLMQAGLIKASPGPHGGIRLNRQADAITALQIVEVLEGPIALQPCPDCSAQCERFNVCSSQFAWNDLQQVVVDYLSSVRLNNLAQTSQTLPVFSMQMVPQPEAVNLS